MGCGVIVIQTDVWRAECIAAIGINEESGELQVFPLNSADYVGYDYDDSDTARIAHKAAIKAWVSELKGGAS